MDDEVIARKQTNKTIRILTKKKDKIFISKIGDK